MLLSNNQFHVITKVNIFKFQISISYNGYQFPKTAFFIKYKQKIVRNWKMVTVVTHFDFIITSVISLLYGRLIFNCNLACFCS